MKRYKIKQWLILLILALITGICLVGWQTQGIAQSSDAQLTLTLASLSKIMET